MIISDLQYIEGASETQSLSGGSRWKPAPYSPQINVGININNQVAIANSVAISIGGPAIASSYAYNSSTNTNIFRR